VIDANDDMLGELIGFMSQRIREIREKELRGESTRVAKSSCETARERRQSIRLVWSRDSAISS
jgi:hypothetical protein